MSKCCDACAKRVNETRNVGGAYVCVKCARDLKEAYHEGPLTMRSPVSSDKRARDPHALSTVEFFTDKEAPDTETWGSDIGREEDENIFLDGIETCPGCGSAPGDGITPGCDDPLGCGHNRRNQEDAIGNAIAHTQRSSHMKHESTKFDGDAYMEETIRLEEARKRQSKAPVERESIGHIRQLRTQEHPNNRIRVRS